MIERLPRIAVLVGAILSVPLLAYMAYSRSVYLTSPTFLAGFILIEFLLAAVSMYRRLFLTIVLFAFLAAGSYMPIGAGMWNVGRWAFLGIGAAVGCFIMLKERQHQFRLFHALAIFGLLAAIASSAVSHYPTFALLKASSLILLFLYAGSGARLAASGRENRFLSGLLIGAELYVAWVAGWYVLGTEAMGNPNSLGAAMGVFAVPVLLWGTMVASSPMVRMRRLVLYGAAMYLVLHSQSRAGLLAAFLSSSVLCLGLRKYKLFARGLLILLIGTTASAIWNPEAFWSRVSAMTSSVVYKDKDPELGLFASRQTTWQRAMDSVHRHFWFGSGFGTTDNGLDASSHLGKFSTAEGVSLENGSSYLAIFTWVGMMGILPFALLLISLFGRVLRTFLWMLHTTNPFHPAVPLAMVIFAGFVNASFEDWMFAPGYYLSVLFWTVAFILVDVAPWAPLPSFSHSWQPALMPNTARGMPSSR